MVNGLHKTYGKNIIREIRGSFGRFLAITAIVALGVGFLVGILSATPDMKHSVDVYYKDTNMTDIFIKATMGLTDRDIEAVREIDGVKEVMPAYVTDILMETPDAQVLVTRDYGLPIGENRTDSFVNELTLLEGRMPESPYECVVQKAEGGFYAPTVGSRITISKENEGYEDIGETYRQTVYTVTGIVRNPFYFSSEKEQSSIGDGKVGMVIYTPEESYALEVYTDFYIVLEGSRELEAFSEEYEDYVQGIVDQIEDIAGVQVRLRYEEIRSEAGGKLQDAKEEYQEKKQEAESELADARTELDQGWEDLKEGKRKITDGEREIAAHEADVAEAEQKLADGREELEEAYQTLYDNEAAIFSSEQELAQGQAQLDEGWGQFHEGEQKIAEAKSRLEEQAAVLAQQEKTLLEAEEQLKATGATYESMQQVKEAMQQFRAALQTGGSGPVQTAFTGSAGPQKAKLYRSGEDLILDPAKHKAAFPVLACSMEAGTGEPEDAGGGRAEVDSIRGGSMESGRGEKSADSQLGTGTGHEKEEQGAGFKEGGLTETPKSEIPQQCVEEGMPQEGIPQQGAEEGVPQQGAEEEMPQQETGEELPPQDPVCYEKTLRAMGVAGQWLGSDLSALLSEDPAGRQLLQSIVSLQPPAELISEEQWTGLGSLIDGCEAQAAAFIGAWEQVQAGKLQIEEGKKQIAAGREQIGAEEDHLAGVRELLQNQQDKLNTASAQLAEGRKELEEGWSQYRESQEAYEDGLVELEKGKKELADARIELADAKKEALEGEADLEQGEREYADAEAEAGKGFAEAEEKIADAQKEIDEIEEPEWYVLDRSSNVTYASYRMNVEKVADVAKVFPIFFFLVSALVSLTTMTRMVEEERVQIGTLKALGYRGSVIMSKYLIYCGLATVIGCGVGLVCGFKLLPTVINQAYESMYDLPALITRINWIYAGISCLLQLFCTLFATYSACRKVLRENPASLMMPKAPKAGQRIFLERIRPLWRHMSFSQKATARNLFRYKKHLFMTVTGIAGCTALILVGFGLKDSMQDVAGTQFTDIFRYDMKISLNAEKTPGEELEGFLREYSYLQAADETMTAVGKKENYTVTLVVPRAAEQLAGFVKLYDRTEKKELHFQENSVFLTEKLADLLSVTEGDSFELENGEKERCTFTVSGITENYAGGYIYMGASAYAQGWEKEEEELDYNTVFVKSGLTDIREQETVIETLLSDERVNGVEFTSQTRSTFERLLGSMNFVIAVLILCAGGLAVIVLYNLTNININERLRELATLRVLGYHHREVARYIFREINLLSLMGIAVGLGLGWLLHRYVILTAESLEMMFGRHVSIMSFIWAATATLGFTFLVDALMSVKLRRIRMAESMKAVE